MERWHLTFALATLALGAALIAPRLSGGADEPVPDVPPAPEAPPEPLIPEVKGVPDRAGHLVVSAGLDRSAIAAGTTSERYLVVTVAAPADLGGERRPVDLTVLVDTSGSMKKQGKLQMAQDAATRLASALGPEDELAIVTFSESSRTLVRPGPGGRPEIYDAIANLRAGGETNLGEGLWRAHTEVIDGTSTGEKRVLVVSDGYPTVGETSGTALGRRVDALRASGVAVSTIGLGVDFDDDLLAGLSRSGGGTYAFVDDASAFEDAFRRELSRSATLVARDTQVRIAMPAGVELVEFVGRDATRDGGGWLVDVGSLSAGEVRKVVARVRVQGGAPGKAAIASVGATWDDRVDDAPGYASVSVAAPVVAAVVEAEKSYEPMNTVAANEARGSWWMDQAARAYSRGDAVEAQQITKRARDELAVPMGAVPATSAPELDDLDEAFARQAEQYDDVQPDSPAARRVVLESKADAYDLGL